MSVHTLLLTIGAGLGGALAYGLALVLGEAALDELKEAIFRGRPFAIRRQRHRPFLIAGYLCGVVAGTAAFVGVAVATNGRPDGPEDARWFFAIAGLVLMAGGVLLAEWWRRSANP